VATLGILVKNPVIILLPKNKNADTTIPVQNEISLNKLAYFYAYSILPAPISYPIIAVAE
jgi:hypothetical protein